MSHSAERKEKNCLNCGTTVIGRYCHVCGQQNVEPKESVWHLVSHFFNDITHFDGKFFQTLRVLLLRPGFLSKEYVNGRRARYLDPVRMYVFTSAIFFLIFFSFFQKDQPLQSIKVNGKTLAEINAMDSAAFAVFSADLHEGGKPMTREQFGRYLDSGLFGGIRVGGTRFTSRKEYDSLLATGQRHDGWLARMFIYKVADINEKYKGSWEQIESAFEHKLVHSLPQMLFVSLPFFALLLRLLYVRRRQFYYVSHGIFGIHLYIFVFISLLVILNLSKVNAGLNSGLLGWVVGLLIVSLFVYEYLAMKNFYMQGWVKTFVKFCLLNIIFLVILALLFVVFTLFSFFNI